MEPDSEEATPERQFTISYSQHYARPQSLQNSPANSQVGSLHHLGLPLDSSSHSVLQQWHTRLARLRHHSPVMTFSPSRCCAAGSQCSALPRMLMALGTSCEPVPVGRKGCCVLQRRAALHRRPVQTETRAQQQRRSGKGPAAAALGARLRWAAKGALWLLSGRRGRTKSPPSSQWEPRWGASCSPCSGAGGTTRWACWWHRGEGAELPELPNPAPDILGMSGVGAGWWWPAGPCAAAQSLSTSCKAVQVEGKCMANDGLAARLRHVVRPQPSGSGGQRAERSTGPGLADCNCSLCAAKHTVSAGFFGGGCAMQTLDKQPAAVEGGSRKGLGHAGGAPDPAWGVGVQCSGQQQQELGGPPDLQPQPDRQGPGPGQ